MVPCNSEMDALQRDGMPEEEEPETGACWNCRHMATVTIGGKTYELCVLSRDVDASGDIEFADPYKTDCMDWDDYVA